MREREKAARAADKDFYNWVKTYVKLETGQDLSTLLGRKIADKKLNKAERTQQRQTDRWEVERTIRLPYEADMMDVALKERAANRNAANVNIQSNDNTNTDTSTGTYQGNLATRSTIHLTLLTSPANLGNPVV